MNLSHGLISTERACFHRAIPLSERNFMQLTGLRGGHDPVALFKQILGVGSTLAHRIIDTLHIDSLEALEVAAYNRRL
jgi:hypothetical protein